MKLKSTIITATAIALLALPGLSFAVTPKENANISAAKQSLEQTKITDLSARGAKEIDRRIAALTALKTKISGLKKLTADQKADLTGQIQANIVELTALKTTISADTTLADLQKDVKTIVSDYRIFALFMPKVNLLASCDRANEVVDSLTALSAKLQTKVTTAKTAGKDVTALQNSLDDMNSQIATAKTKISGAIAVVTPLDPSGYPGNKTQLQSARSELNAARKNLATARADAATVITGLGTVK